LAVPDAELVVVALRGMPTLRKAEGKHIMVVQVEEIKRAVAPMVASMATVASFDFRVNCIVAFILSNMTAS
jgi:hypothetical protein